MAKYMISFPSAAMVVPDGEWEAVGRDVHAVIRLHNKASRWMPHRGVAAAETPSVLHAVPLNTNLLESLR